MLRKKIDFKLEKVSQRVQIKTKTPYDRHIYEVADYKSDKSSRLCPYCTPAATRLVCPHMFATYFYLIF